jgi:hypothetical protein
MQADAWLAIFALCKSLDTELETTSEVWSRAISRTTFALLHYNP